MNKPPDFKPLACRECMELSDLGFDFTMAFQPIVNLHTQTVFAHEALVRGLNNEPAGHVFAQVNDSNRYRFDQGCRVKAIALAAKLGLPGFLSINFMPNAVYRPELCIRTTLQAAEENDFPIDRIIFEVVESERVQEHSHLQNIVEHYKQRGFTTAIDDFGAGYASLNLLADFDADLIKIDMALVRGIHGNRARQTIVKAICQVCTDLDKVVIAEGVESYEEMCVLRDLGIELFQGYYFAKPGFESLPEIANLSC